MESVCDRICGKSQSSSDLVHIQSSKIQVHCITIEYFYIGIIKYGRISYKCFQLLLCVGKKLWFEISSPVERRKSSVKLQVSRKESESITFCK